VAVLNRLDFPSDTVTTIIMQGWNDPYMVAYAHANGIRVLQAVGCEAYDLKANTSWCSKLADPVFFAQQVSAYNESMRQGTLDGFGWDVEEIDPAFQPDVARFIGATKAAYPELFHCFYVGNLVATGWMSWQAAPIKAIGAVVDLVIVSAYTETNDTAAAGPGKTMCSRPCPTSSLPTVDGALHGTPLPNGTRAHDSWATIVPKEKLVLALGWFHQQWLANMTENTPHHAWPWSGPYELGRRISFCQAISLYKSLGDDREERRHWDPGSNSWWFNCEHDAADPATFQGCGPWSNASQPVTTQIWYDDHVSSDSKLAAVKQAGWKGVGFWQASGMWPGGTSYYDVYDNTTNIAVYCKREILELWSVTSQYFGS
jgi:hypothetical protein